MNIKTDSILKAQWAVFFDVLGIECEYRKNRVCFWDFYLPQVRMWAKIKSTDFDHVEKQRMLLLATETERPVLMLVGSPENKPYFAIEPFELFAEDWIVERDYCLTMYHNYPIDEHRFYTMPCDDEDSHYDDTQHAADVARQVGFECGLE